MATSFEPPPTYADVVLVDQATKAARFNPIWLGWFVKLAGFVSESGGAGGGAANHNDLAGLQGGAAGDRYHLTSAQSTQVLALATPILVTKYTPTLTNVANLDASTAYETLVLRVGTFVIHCGRVDVDPTAAGNTQLGISLNVASNLGAPEDLNGVAFASGVAGQGAAIRGDAANNRAEMVWVAVDTTNQPMYFIFGYEVI